VSRFLNKVSLVSIGLTLTAILIGAEGSGASAHNSLAPTNAEPIKEITAPVAQPLPAAETVAPTVEPAVEQDIAPVDEEPVVEPGMTLAEMVAAQGEPGELSKQMRCLAGAIYFESKSESLEGQYAVGRVIIARTQSKRYPSTYCGVVYQRSQFSFVRGGSMPAINTTSRDWREAVAIARLSHAGEWTSPVEGAMSFHAARVSPGWRLTRVARLGNHVFYR